MGGPYDSTKLAHFPRQNLWGKNLGAVSGFLLLEIVIFLLIYFPEANKISLSLWVSPHWGFPWPVA
jgi:hypothetical protein